MKKRSTWRAEIVVTMPRLMASSANARGVQWLRGRPAAAGGSHASAMIGHHCWALKVAGVPGRGASCTRSSTGQCGRARQGCRHRRTVRRLVPSRYAALRALCPSARCRRICARQLKGWGVVCARMRGSSSWCSPSPRDTGGALADQAWQTPYEDCRWGASSLHLAVTSRVTFFCHAVLACLPGLRGGRAE